MNILYILGNGFDKSLGLKTSYPEFYAYLEELKERNELDVQMYPMLASIKKEEANWADMESKLGGFTEQFDTEADYITFHQRLGTYLRTYLEEQEGQFSPTPTQKAQIKECIRFPKRLLSAYVQETYKLFVSNANLSSPYNYNVISLNYTRTLEKILYGSIPDSCPSVNLYNSDYILRDIKHVHGNLKSSIIIGVDNENQIANPSFRDSDDVKDWLVKSQSNHAMGNTLHENCKAMIEQANVIVIYGASLGRTDDMWWKLIGDQMHQRKNLAIIFNTFRTEASDPTTSQLHGKIGREALTTLTTAMGLTKDETSEMKNRLFISINAKFV